MISLSSPDPEPGPHIFALTSATMYKVLARATCLSLGGGCYHGKLTKHAKLPGGVEGFEEGHTLLGYFNREPRIGEGFLLVRYNTAGREAYGAYQTSQVAMVVPDLENASWEFTTQNSMYVLEMTEDPLEGT